MKSFAQKFIKICPKTGRFIGFKTPKGYSYFLFPFIGFIALLWILFRVITKPSRINYPCVKAAMPFAAGFLGNVVVLIISIAAFFKLRKTFFKHQYIFAALLVTFSLGGNYFSDNNSEKFSKIYRAYHISNEPMGEAKGIFPGRVVWVHDPDATNEDCVPGAQEHQWFLPENNNQQVIDLMVSRAIQQLTGTETDSDAWDSIFIYHNTIIGKGRVNYSAGEKVFIKINATSGWSGNFNPMNLTPYASISETSPAVVLSMLRQLVNVIGVSQSDIYVGDPMKHIYKHSYDLWHGEFPSIHYLDHDGYTNLGREKVVVSNTAIITYSDKGSVLRTGDWNDASTGDPVYEDYLYAIFEQAEYMINIPMLKGHKRAGITMFAKNHLGSHIRGDAKHLHMGLVAPDEFPDTARTGYGLYRVQVDLMGHKLLGEKNLVYLMDALWATEYELDIPRKWEMSPFNNDFMSSVFASLDPVAIESVGFDFLRTEYTSYPQMNGTDDYLHQAADSSNWPDNIVYEPSGERLASLGIHEHWDNPEYMKYSRNVGTGNGIELLKASVVSVENISSSIPEEFILYPNYPNPFNPSTVIEFGLKKESIVELYIYDINGKLIDVLIDNKFMSAGNYKVKYVANSLSSGVYFVFMKAGGHSNSIKMILIK